MITAVDTSVLLDVFLADPRHGPASKALLRRCLAEGRVVASPPVVAEITVAFDDERRAREALERLPIEPDLLDEACAYLAGETMRAYRTRGGRRSRVMADFLIGAHARLRADRLLTRDRGFHHTYFEGLTLIEP